MAYQGFINLIRFLINRNNYEISDVSLQSG